MTVTYSAKVATANFNCFFKLLVRWRGSIYKILWKEFIVFSVAYFILSFVYRCALTQSQKEYFEKGAEYCAQFSSLIPVSFVLGFYVNHIASLWWEKFRTLPWIGAMSMFVTAHLCGHDERARLMRRTIMRYMCLSYVITMSSISPPVKKRFPSWKYMTDAGLMLPNEEKIIENINTPYNKFLIPLVWASALVMRARKEGRIKDDFAVKTLIDEINTFRAKSFALFNYDWVTIPVVYTQVVTLAVYTFFLSCLMGRQYLDNGNMLDMYFPLFTFLQFFFYMGWLKVAETMLNPFGEDDDDFDINYLIDRNLKISYLVVDEMHEEHPELIRDQYWDTAEFELPYTEETKQFKHAPHLGSALDLNVHHERGSLGPSSLMSVPEEDFEMTEISIAPLYPRKASTASHQPSSSPKTIATSIRSAFHRRSSNPRDTVASSLASSRHRPLPRISSKSSIDSQASERVTHDFFQSLKKAIGNKNRRQSFDESDSESHGVKSKSKRLFTPSRVDSFHSNDHQPLAPESYQDHHDSQELMVFHMSDSDSDDSTTSATDKITPNSTRKVKTKHSKSGGRCTTDDNQVLIHKEKRSDSGHSGLEYRGSKRCLKDEVLSPINEVPDSGKPASEGRGSRRCLKDVGRHKDDEPLSPINEDPDSSSTDSVKKEDPLVVEVRRRLSKLQDCTLNVAQLRRNVSSPSMGMDTLSLFGTSNKSTVTDYTQTQIPE